MTKISILDLAPVIQGDTPAGAFKNSLDLAQHAEKWGYNRYWLAEHHNMPGIASAATSVVIGHIAAGTKTIRVGSGGIMLPNHSPLVIAEQFGTLESLFPGRIDLGLGRAPGTDQLTMRALRRRPEEAHHFPSDVHELQTYFADTSPDPVIQAVPGRGLHVPIWLLGSSTFSAQLAAALGLPFAFASHFAPSDLLDAVYLYRAQFKPSATLEKPYVMAGLNVFAADDKQHAAHLFTSVQQQFLNLRRGKPGLLPPPTNMDNIWSEAEKRMVAHALHYSLVGDFEDIKTGLQDFITQVQPDEIIATAQIYNHADRLRSFELFSQAQA